ncbi:MULTISPECIES: benzoate 1,2-dioxygenase electron transfer component BenC [Actibacterium]|uniref:Benzoate/toluate 1,2-dioxygenase reductase subunit n=1 Tax=Actibacterium naphthalenivorans TaxID=1614693 RepID=A0A840CAC2_9RHOB|nr:MULTISPECIES: benzoate 1,2-dioxygenase electron transfer component BenC [Actibacterium]ALG91500.1 NADH oxidase [Actibacterium sp. EMB200-NS6]MBB4022941.1 benzoate/toluate 1,2-dioxygenase reductase subunit [Actibacterium naphthalenivorans]
MSYKIALNFEDGVTRIIDCDEDELVTDAAFRQRINVPMDCRDGVCGTCKCFCEEGSYELEFYHEDAMTEEEEAEGYVLTCQMTPESDCVIRVPASSLACKTGAEKVPATVTAVETLSDTSFRLEVTPAKQVAFLPGQYVNIEVPGTGQHRSYSFSSHPDAATGSFLIRNLPGGMMSTYLAERAKAGDTLELTGPMGTFYLRPAERPLLFLAGGTGLAPFLSMLELLADKPTEHPIRLFYAVTRDADLVELDRITALAAKMPNLTVETVVADADSDHAKKGFVTDHLTAEDFNGGDVDVYLCGPPPMVDAVRGHMADLGVTPAHFHFEKFNPSEAEADAA